MFKPKFKYTDRMVELLTKIAAAREVILGSPLIPRWEVSLRKEAIIRSAHSSTSIEGNNLSLEQVSELAAGRKIMASRKDKQEVLNYIKVLESLDELAQDGKFSESSLKNIQKRDLTFWLEYFTEGVAVSMTSVREKVARLSNERTRIKKRGQIALTDRQLRIVEHCNMNGRITISEIASMFRITRQAALKEINKMIQLDIIKREGKARVSFYIMR